jgi:pertussis toxin subunit 1
MTGAVPQSSFNVNTHPWGPQPETKKVQKRFFEGKEIIINPLSPKVSDKENSRSFLLKNNRYGSLPEIKDDYKKTPPPQNSQSKVGQDKNYINDTRQQTKAKSSTQESFWQKFKEAVEIGPGTHGGSFPSFPSLGRVGAGLVVGCQLFGQSNASEAKQENAPRVVMRVDSRGPNEIFKNGFKAWGQNDNVLDHLSGQSIHVTGDSAFIATTEDKLVTAIIFQTFCSQNSSATKWGYSIYTDGNFYEANKTLESIIKNPDLHPNYPANKVETAKVLLEKTAKSQEWLAKSAIPPTSVIDAAQMKCKSQSKVEIIQHKVNGSAKKPTSRANTEPYVRESNPSTQKTANRARTDL